MSVLMCTFASMREWICVWVLTRLCVYACTGALKGTAGYLRLETKTNVQLWDSRAGNRRNLNHAGRIKCISCYGERVPDVLNGAGRSYTLINECNHF